MGTVRKLRRFERGATAVEAALVAPLVFLVLFGIMEFSLLFRSSLGVTNAANDGARAASVAGRDLDADYLTLRQIDKSSAAIDSNEIDRIIIFRGAEFDDPVPPACLAVAPPGGITDVCNVYGPDQMQWPESEFGCNPANNPRPDPDRYWCPDDRVVSVGTGLDYVGVHIELEHEFATGMVGDRQDVSDTAVLKIEPEAQ